LGSNKVGDVATLATLAMWRDYSVVNIAVLSLFETLALSIPGNNFIL